MTFEFCISKIEESLATVSIEAETEEEAKIALSSKLQQLDFGNWTDIHWDHDQTFIHDDASFWVDGDQGSRFNWRELAPNL